MGKMKVCEYQGDFLRSRSKILWRDIDHFYQDWGVAFSIALTFMIWVRFYQDQYEFLRSKQLFDDRGVLLR